MVPKRGESFLSQADSDRLTIGLAFLEAFRTIRPTMPLQHAYAFMLVAMEEGLGVTEYAERAGVAQTVMTRHLLDIGMRNRRREEGYGLVVQRMDPMDMRKHQTFLTSEGRALIHKVLRALR
jgi:DNA-binding MarR family transcriptional regulator